MAPLSNPAKYKKSQGVLTIDLEADKLLWQGDGAVAPSVQLKLSNIEHLQATPATSAKSMIKIMVKDETDPFTFLFSARPILASVRDVLSALIHERQAKESAKSQPDAAKSSSPPAPAAAPGKKPRQKVAPPSAVPLDTKSLLRNLKLQQDVIQANADIKRAFEDAVITGGLSHEDFWSTRIHVLRAHVLATSQKRGPYNVLSTIKHKTNSENQQTLTLSVEKINDIYEQYPIVYQAYKDNVPPMDSNVFWVEFFSSRLFRRLRGDRIKPSDPTNTILDKYLDYLDNYETNKQATLLRKRKQDEDARTGDNGGSGEDIEVPFFINIEGNEENDPQRLGNRPDYTMRAGAEGPSALTLLKSMNWLSQRMVYGQEGSAVAGGANGSAGGARAVIVPMHDQDESHLMDELRIRGLEDEQQPEYMKLEMKAADESALLQQQVAANNVVAANGGGGGEPEPAVDYGDSLRYMEENVRGSVDLQEVGAGPGRAEALKRAQKHIMRTVKLRSKEGGDNRGAAEREVEEAVGGKVGGVHATAVEFLRHFWAHFLSGDAAQAQAVNRLVAGLRRSLEKIDALEKREEGQPYCAQVIAALGPLVDSITKALEAYQGAIAAYQAEAAGAAGAAGVAGTPVNGTSNGG